MSNSSRRAFLGSAAVPFIARAAAQRPNILMIVTDDQRYDAFSASGHGGILSFLQTPNMDRLAREGVHFRNTYVTTSLCSPSRATIMSAKNARTQGVWSLRGDLPPGCRIFPGLLREAGYDTGFVGKWHLGVESEKPNPAFNYWAGFRDQGAYFDPLLNVNGTPTPTKGYVTEILTDQAVEFLRKPRRGPFCLYVGHKAPHGPCTPPKHLESLYEDVNVPLPTTYYENHRDKPAWYLNFHDHDHWHKELHPVERYQKYVKDYCRALVSVDDSLGRLMKVLEETGVAGNTAVILLGDNGHFLGEHQFYSKMIMYEEAIRIPLLVRYPKLARAGTKRDEMMLNADLAPTVLDLAGVTVPKDMEGRSAKALLAGKKVRDWRRSFLYEWSSSGGWGLPSLEGVRTADGWQYARYFDWEQLYDMNTDPTQVRNLATDPRYRSKKEQLQRELQRLGGGRRLDPPRPYKRRSEDTHTPHATDFK
jgi:N-acetylglucosamine-6-sulfatase